MNELKNWTRVARGLYKYSKPTESGKEYEIHLKSWDNEGVFTMFDAKLYMISIKTDNGHGQYERDLVGIGTVGQCMYMANNYEEMLKVTCTSCEYYSTPGYKEPCKNCTTGQYYKPREEKQCENCVWHKSVKLSPLTDFQDAPVCLCCGKDKRFYMAK